MSSQPFGRTLRLWVWWKSLNLPWRRKRLAGIDLAGTTFWEFKDSLNANRLRRIAKHSSKRHYADTQWHQWLRHVREHPPSVEEQHANVARQHHLKYLAQLADERWANKESYLDMPREETQHLAQEQTATVTVRARQDTNSSAELVRGDGLKTTDGNKATTQADDSSAREDGRQSSRPEDPWKRDRGGPSEQWQPEAWVPKVRNR